MPVFAAAFKLALAVKAHYHAVDAAHMLGITAEGAESLLEWNLKSVALLDARAEGRPFFAQACAALSQDAWLVQDEPERLGRLLVLSGC